METEIEGWAHKSLLLLASPCFTRTIEIHTIYIIKPNAQLKKEGEIEETAIMIIEIIDGRNGGSGGVRLSLSLPP